MSGKAPSADGSPRSPWANGPPGHPVPPPTPPPERIGAVMASSVPIRYRQAIRNSPASPWSVSRKPPIKRVEITAGFRQPQFIKMKIDPLKLFARLREALISEKMTIETRLRELNEVLGAESAQTTAVPIATSLDKVAADYLEKDLGGYTPRNGSLPAKILK